MIYVVYVTPRTGKKRDDAWRHCIAYADTTDELRAWIDRINEQTLISVPEYGLAIKDVGKPTERVQCCAVDANRAIECGVAKQALPAEWNETVRVRTAVRDTVRILQDAQ